MKLLTICSLFLILFVSYTTAQWQRCGGRIWSPNCVQPLNWGYQGSGCPPPRVMWYYDRSVGMCRQMNYLGCGGNGNRWCSRAACEQRCRRW